MEWEDVATKLLDKKLYLSALELYYELLENNQEINSLRDFFSNPGNFETFYNIRKLLRKHCYMQHFRTLKTMQYLLHDLI